MNCATQLNAEMTMRDFEEFYSHPDRWDPSWRSHTSPLRDDTKLNVISLEFSNTRMEEKVAAPRVVRQVVFQSSSFTHSCSLLQIDWVDHVWPRHLKEDQQEGTNDLRKMKYPKVCLLL